MKRLIALLLCLLAGTASAEVTAPGAVTLAGTATLTASMGGGVSSVRVLAGDYIRPGDALLTLSTNRVYAPCAGTVESIPAGLGQSADAAVEQYGGALTLAPESLYTVYASTEDGYGSVRVSRYSSGQTVYMKCTEDGSHRGVGRITRIEDGYFLVEVTGGAFYNGETVYVCMDADCDKSDRLGAGTVVASEVQYVQAKGDVVRVHVSPGDFVEKGQLLMETLDALPLDGFLAGDFILRAASEGYVTAVYPQAGQALERGGLVLSYCPADTLDFTAQISADDLPFVTVGAQAAVTFELAEETLQTTGTVQAISFLPVTTEAGTAYDARIAIALNEKIRPGMHGTAVIGGGG